MDVKFSIIIPVYNRPDEIDELLKSLMYQDYSDDFEVIIVEDGSEISAKNAITKYRGQLQLSYYYKENSGPGLSRNFAMQKATGNYFIILDSDCILPPFYITEVSKALAHTYTDAYGGPDAADDTFTTIQKAINYSMTSFLTTGGIRGKKNSPDKFQPRSFNMGISKKAFKSTKGFGSQRFGEDIDLAFRLWENGFETQLIEKALVYHKRRVDFKSFFKQTFHFGAARPILNKQHPKTAKITYWFPSIFIIALVGSILFSLAGIYLPLQLFVGYFLLIFTDAFFQSKNISVALYSILTTIIQFFGYGLGFLRSFFRLHLMQKSTIDTFPEMFKSS